MIIFAYGIVKCLLDKTFKTILRIFYQYRPRFHTETRRADIIILAHWQLLKKQYPSRYLVIATTNVKHFQGFAEALNWQDINI